MVCNCRICRCCDNCFVSIDISVFNSAKFFDTVFFSASVSEMIPSSCAKENNQIQLNEWNTQLRRLKKLTTATMRNSESFSNCRKNSQRRQKVKREQNKTEFESETSPYEDVSLSFSLISFCSQRLNSHF